MPRSVFHHRTLIWTLVALTLASGCGSPADAPQDSGSQADATTDASVSSDASTLPRGVYALTGIDPTLPVEDLAPLDDLLGDADIIGLGENAHQCNTYIQARDRITRYLVERHGVRVVGLETSRTNAETLETYAQSCTGDPTTLLANLHPIWRGPELVDFLQWLCAHNQQHPADPVSLFGFDVVDQASTDASELADFATVVMPSTDATAVEAGLGECPEVTSPAAHSSYTSCTTALDQLEAYVDAHVAEVIQATSETTLEWSRIWLASLRGITGYRYLDQNPSDFLVAWGARDEAMAEIVTRLRSLRFADGKTVLWAHNGHVANGMSTLQVIYPAIGIDFVWGVRSMGQALAETPGTRYAALGLTTYRFVAGASSYPLPPSPDNVTEPYLSELLWTTPRPTGAPLLLDTSQTGADALLTADQQVLLRVRNNFRDADDFIQLTSPDALYDAMLWVEEATCGQDWLP